MIAIFSRGLGRLLVNIWTELEWSDGANHKSTGGRVSQQEETTSTKSLRGEHIWPICGRARRAVCVEQESGRNWDWRGGQIMWDSGGLVHTGMLPSVQGEAVEGFERVSDMIWLTESRQWVETWRHRKLLGGYHNSPGGRWRWLGLVWQRWGQGGAGRAETLRRWRRQACKRKESRLPLRVSPWATGTCTDIENILCLQLHKAGSSWFPLQANIPSLEHLSWPPLIRLGALSLIFFSGLNKYLKFSYSFYLTNWSSGFPHWKCKPPRE